MKKLALKSVTFLLAITVLYSCATENNTGNNIVKTVPQLTTATITNITLTSASSGGNITSDGGEAVTARGIFWTTTSTPTTNSSTKTTDGAGTGTFSSAITNLTPSSTYFVRAYATNNVGTAYGNELSFTTGAIVLPTLSTSATKDLAANTAISGGNITNDGGATITARGVCWSTTNNPTTALSTTTTDGLGAGLFTSSISGLAANTVYYLRSYATNSAGTSYGNLISFTTLPFTIIAIGTQTWSSQNLDVTTYADGTPIPQVTDPTAWNNLTTGAWCYYNNDPSNDSSYGKLYNGYAVAGIYDAASLNNSSLRKLLAPQGWHIPSTGEWDNLFEFLTDANRSGEGSKLKETGAMHWLASCQSASNSSGFTGRPGGYRAMNRTVLDNKMNFEAITLYGAWWTSTSSIPITNPLSGWIANVSCNHSKLYINTVIPYKSGHSVRCVKD